MDKTELDLSRILVTLDGMSKNMSSDMREMKNHLTVLDKKVSELNIHYFNQVKEDARINNRLDTMEGAVNDFGAFINKAKGALALVLFFQTALLAGASWLVTSVISHEKEITLIEHQISVERVLK